MSIFRTYLMGTRVICEQCATREPLALLVEQPAHGGVAIRCHECRRLIEREPRGRTPAQLASGAGRLLAA